MSLTVRFAPSPTGNIHIGNARTALINWLYAKRQGGQFILRFDDTDRERSKEEYAQGIARDLAWLGIEPDRVERQSARMAEYGAVTEKLKADGLLYACYEAPDELDRKRKRQAGRGLPPVYDRAGLKLSDDERKELEAKGRKPHWRFLLPNFESDAFAPQRTEVRWDDLVRGPQTIDLASMSDPVLVREDGTWPYTLPSVVDDIDFGITHVIRGDDHVANTAVQIALFEALGAKPPMFGHHNLLMNASGEGLSKRLGSLSIHNLAEAGYEPMAVASLAVLIGMSGSVEAMRDMDALAERADLSAISKSAAKFDMAELDGLNAKLVHGMEWVEVRERFDPEAFGGQGEAFWPVVRENIDKVGEAPVWWERLVTAEPVIGADDREFLVTARRLLPESEIGPESWREWTTALKEETGRKGRALFMPLRKALTGQEHGPDMSQLLPFIGRERILARLP
ncbi:MAG: glutamate--tRNA ligase [Salaquimonas sp.]|jgi:glutamyl-tRNA synthetase|nr:glutamate--tRNA ligase [Salaquimonas sp.]